MTKPFTIFPCRKLNAMGQPAGHPVTILREWTGAFVKKNRHTGCGWMNHKKFNGSHVEYISSTGARIRTRRNRILFSREEYLRWIDQRQRERYNRLTT